jgi:dihydrofolate reductase
VSSWVTQDFRRCFQVMEAEDPSSVVPLAHRERVQVADPFGNRIELIEWSSVERHLGTIKKTLVWMRKIIVYIATSADGYIARPDGNVDWLNRPQTAGDYGMRSFYRSIDTILWGRKTYELALSFQKQGIPGADFDPKVNNYIFSRHPPQPRPGVVEFVGESIPSFVKRVRAAQGKNIWMMGGAGLIASFLDAGEVDEFIIHMMPIFIGAGIPLIEPQHRSVPLALRSSRRYSDGVVRLHYAVVKPRSKRTARTR